MLEEENNTKITREAYSVSEVAWSLGISVRKAWDEIKTGRLGHKPIGRRIVVTRRHLAEYLSTDTTGVFDARRTAQAILAPKPTRSKKG